VSLARTISAMVAAGCTPQQLEAVVCAHEAGEAQRLAEKRAKNAERQRRHRKSRDVTVTERDERDTPSALNDVQPNLVNVQVSLNPPPPYSPPAARRNADWPEDFCAQLWEIYPRKTEKKAGMEALTRIYRADRVSWLEIVNGVELLFGCDPQYVPALCRWLKGERWKDERPTAKPPPGKPQRRNPMIDGLDEIERRYSDERPFQPRLVG
jgi:hypothetical protein